MIERPRDSGSLTFVFALPASTSHAEKTPRMAEKSDGRPRQLARLGFLFGGIGHPAEELTTRNSPTKRCFKRVAFIMCPVALFILEQRKPMASK